MSRELQVVVVAICMALLGACAPPGTLAGSIEAEYSLTYDQIRAHRFGERLVISYEDRVSAGDAIVVDGEFRNQVARIVLFTGRQALEEDVEIPIVGADVGYPVGIVERYVVEKSEAGGLVQGKAFPQVRSATVRFTELGEKDGDRIVGEFHATFANDRNIGGEFQAELTPLGL